MWLLFLVFKLVICNNFCYNIATMKYLVVALLVVGALVLYLNRAYAHIFSYLNSRNPGNPTTNVSITFQPSNTSGSKITYVALGDSLTAGVGAADSAGAYPFKIAKLLADGRDAEVTLVNLGQSGAVSDDVLRVQVPQVAALHPNVVTLLIGINDLHNRVSEDTFQENLINIVDALSLTTKHINIITIPYLGGTKAFLPPYQTYFNWETKGYNNALRVALAEKNITLIDLYSFTKDRERAGGGYYSADDFHPSTAAYNFWGKTIYDNLDY